MPISRNDEAQYGKLTHLGDGAYVSFDGYQLWLHADRQGMTHRVALDSGAYSSLLEFVADHRRRAAEIVEVKYGG